MFIEVNDSEIMRLNHFVVSNDPLFSFFGKNSMDAIMNRHIVNTIANEYVGIIHDRSGFYIRDKGFGGHKNILNQVQSLFSIPDDIIDSHISLLIQLKEKILSVENNKGPTATS